MVFPCCSSKAARVCIPPCVRKVQYSENSTHILIIIIIIIIIIIDLSHPTVFMGSFLAASQIFWVMQRIKIR